MGKALRQIEGDDRAELFAYWRKHTWETEDLPVGLLMAASTNGESGISQAVGFGLSKLGLGGVANSPIAKAYDAPFPDPSYKMGPRAMPSQAPTLPDDPVQTAQAEAWKVLEAFEKPFLCAFGDSDPATRGADQEFIERVAGAKGQPHTTIMGAGRFIQAEQPEAISQVVIDFVRRTSVSSEG